MTAAKATLGLFEEKGSTRTKESTRTKGPQAPKCAPKWGIGKVGEHQIEGAGSRNKNGGVSSWLTKAPTASGAGGSGTTDSKTGSAASNGGGRFSPNRMYASSGSILLLE